MKWMLASLFSAPLIFQTAAMIAPKVMILSMFSAEADVWYNIAEFNVLARNISVPGLSPIYPQVHCTRDGSICQLTVGEGQINAASSIAALVHSPLTCFTHTYFLLAGIAGVNPKVATIGSVTFARYAVQVGLQYEIDAREIPANFSTGYFSQGTTAPGKFPTTLYGTEVFEVNEPLRQLAFAAAKKAKLVDASDAQQMRMQYAASSSFARHNKAGPSVVLCDTATSDTFWSGNLLGEAFENTTKVFTNGAGVYCTTQQEDNATLNALLRGALSMLVDFSRIVVMRSASDFDRPLPGQSAVDQLLGHEPGFEPAILNLRAAGMEVVKMIVGAWTSTFEDGIEPTNYVGDVFGSLGGVPDFVPRSVS